MVERVEVLIRQAREGDLSALEWEGRYQHFRRLYRRAMSQAKLGHRILLVAEVDGRIVGQIFAQLASGRADLADGASSGYLYAFRVRPNYRNQGIGTRLIESAQDELRRRGFRRVVIAVAKTNMGARRLYEKLGYKRFAEDPGEWSYIDHEGKLRHVSEPAYVLEREL
jgi:ribosomal protein S18 acetylase RimI-like enzyme